MSALSVWMAAAPPQWPARNPGESTAALISQPSDGSQRACANYIFFVNNIASDGVTAHAVLTPSHRYVLRGGSTWFSVKGADASYASAVRTDRPQLHGE